MLTFLIVIAFVSIIAWGFSRVARYVIGEAAHFQSLYGTAANWLEQHGVVVAGLWAERFNMNRMIRIFQEFLNTVNGTLSFSLIVLIYVVLGLLEVDVAAQKLGMVRSQEVSQRLLAGLTATAAKLRRYMAVRTMMSIATGLLVWAFASVTGLQLALEWGVIAFMRIPTKAPGYNGIMPPGIPE